MTDTMTVLFVNHSGHALAAVTRNADESEISAQDLARDGLLVRFFPGNQRFEVPPAELAVVNADLDTALLLQPRAFSIDDGQPVQTPTAVVSNVTLTATNVTVALAAAVTEETKVWVQVDGGNLAEPRVAKGSIAAGASSTVLQIVTLDPGTYFILTLVADRTPDVRSPTI